MRDCDPRRCLIPGKINRTIYLVLAGDGFRHNDSIVHLIVHDQCLYSGGTMKLLMIFNSILIVFNSIRRTSRSKNIFPR